MSMTCGTLNNCCFFFQLRPGTLVIACVCLVFEAISLIVNSLIAWSLSIQYGNSLNGYVYVLRFLIFLFMLLICYKLVLGGALLIGLFKRLPDHLEMWYKGYLLCVLLQTLITVCTAVKEYDNANVMFWIIITERFIVVCVTIYFILVVRSYYFKMCKESNYYQNMIYTEESKDEDVKKTAIYEEVKFTQPLQNNKDLEAPKYGFTKGGGVVYSAPRPQPTAVMDMPMPMGYENGEQCSMLYPSLPSTTQ